MSLCSGKQRSRPDSIRYAEIYSLLGRYNQQCCKTSHLIPSYPPTSHYASHLPLPAPTSEAPRRSSPVGLIQPYLQSARAESSKLRYGTGLICLVPFLPSCLPTSLPSPSPHYPPPNSRSRRVLPSFQTPSSSAPWCSLQALMHRQETR